MKRKIVNLLFIAVMTGSLFIGCGQNDEYDEEYEWTEEQEETEDDTIEDDTIVKEVEISVTDAYSDAILDSEFSVEILCYHIPKITINGETDIAINTKIKNELSAILEEDVYKNIKEGASPLLSDMVYTWGKKDDIISIVVCTNCLEMAWTEYYVYSISSDTKEEISNEELVALYNLSEQEFYELAEETLERYWDSRSDLISAFGEEEYNTYRNQTLEEENVKASIPYINANGDLCIVTKVYWPVGGGEDLRMFNTNTSAEIEESYLECNLDHSLDVSKEVETQNISSSENTPSSEMESTQIESEVKEPNSTRTISKEELIGEWKLDSEYTMEYNKMSIREMYGSAFSYSVPLMEFKEDGSFSYYIGFEYGDGTYILEEDGIVVNLMELDSGEPMRKLVIDTDNQVRIGMDNQGVWTFWIKK